MSRTAIDLRLLHYARTGFYRFAQGLLGAIARHPPDCQILLLRLPEQDLRPVGSMDFEELPVAVPLFDVEEPGRLERALRAADVDTVHFPFSLFPGRPACRVILTIHDLTSVRHPETLEPFYRPHYRSAVERAVEADLVTVVSETVRRELVEAGCPPGQIVVARPMTPFEGYGTALVSHRPSPVARFRDRPFVLAVGSLEPRKDWRRAICVFEALRDRGDVDARLVIVAGHGWLEDEVHAQLEESRWKADIDLRRGVEDGELVDLLHSCAVFLSLSLYEGFGLPALEALEAGACLVSSPIPSLVEAGVSADDLVSPGESAERTAERLAVLLADERRRQELAARQRDAAAGFYRRLDPTRLASIYSRTVSDTEEPR